MSIRQFYNDSKKHGVIVKVFDKPGFMLYHCIAKSLYQRARRGFVLKIGAFSKECGLSLDTVRFYIKSGILMPAREGAQYSFSQNDVRIAKKILTLKQMHFSIQEMKSYLSLIYLLGENDPIVLEEQLRLFENKKKELQSSISERQHVISLINEAEYMYTDSGTEHVTTPLGVPLVALPLLCCPHCARQLSIRDASLASNYVYSGTLFCECGYSASITDGIIDTGNRYSGDYDHPDTERVLYRSYEDVFHKDLFYSSAFFNNELSRIDLSGKVLFEGYINNLVYTCHNLQVFPDDCICILVDKFPEVLQLYKMLCERCGFQKKIVFIASSSEILPIKQKSIDIVLDFFAENENSLYSSNTYFSILEPFLKNEACILSVYNEPKQGDYWRKIKETYPQCARECPPLAFLQAEKQSKGFQIKKRVGSKTVYDSIIPSCNPISFDKPVEMELCCILAERGTIHNCISADSICCDNMEG